MKIDFDAFLNSLPIMGVGLLGIFIVTAVIIIGIYFLRAVTAERPGASVDNSESTSDAAVTKKKNSPTEKESPMDLMKSREKQDFLESDNHFDVSSDL